METREYDAILSEVKMLALCLPAKPDKRCARPASRSLLQPCFTTAAILPGAAFLFPLYLKTQCEGSTPGVGV